jgi:hypothetical protein
VQIRPQKIVFEKNKTKNLKKTEFYADFKTVEKIAKKFTNKKLLTKM